MMTVSQARKEVRLDDILEKYDLWGRYHVFAFSLLSIAFIFNSMYSVNFVFVTEDVRYICKIKQCENENIVWHDLKSEHNKCYRSEVFANGTCFNQETRNASKLVPCDEWIYEDPKSFVAEFNLACQDWKRTLVGTIHMVGLMCGLLLMGPMSDRFGRKTIFIFTATAGGVFGLTKSFVTSYWLYVILEFFGTFLGDLCSSSFTMTIEIVSKEKRVLYQMVSGLAYAVGGVLFAGITWALPYWRYYIRAIYAPSILFLTYTFIIDESSRWLLSKGRKDDAIKIIEKSAATNKIKIEKDLLDDLTADHEENTDFKIVLITTIKSKILLKRLLICMFWWITITFCSYGLTINVVTLGGNKYLNFMWVYLSEIPAIFLLVYAFVNFKRQKPLFLAFILGGVVCLSQPFLPVDMNWLRVLFYLGGKFTVTFTFWAVYIYTSELFPTYTRNSMHALCSCVGRIGSMVAPQTPLLIKYWPGLPTVLFGLVSAIAGILTLLVPDPVEEALPDTVREAEKVAASKLHITKL